MRCYNCGNHVEPLRSQATGGTYCPACGVLLERGRGNRKHAEHGTANPFFRTPRALEICRITMAWSFGFISNAERQQMVDELMTSEPELPLGIGAPTVAAK